MNLVNEFGKTVNVDQIAYIEKIGVHGDKDYAKITFSGGAELIVEQGLYEKIMTLENKK